MKTIFKIKKKVRSLNIVNKIDFQGHNWERFYKFNKTNFFKDRHYILREFTELRDDLRV